MSDLEKPENTTTTSDSDSKKKKKPLWKRWKFWIGTPLLIVLVTYICLWIRLFAHKPVLSHNYSAELNAPILEVPEEKRAWTHYRRALIELEPQPKLPKDTDPEGVGSLVTLRERELAINPDGPYWNITVAYLQRNRKALSMFRQASEIRPLGCLLQDQIDPKDVPCLLRHKKITL